MSLKSPCFFGVQETEGTYEISIELTNECNLKCKHCMNRSKIEDEICGLSDDELDVLIEEFVDNNVEEVYITGGEPTLHPYFFEFVRKLHDNNILVLLATNAYEIPDGFELIKEKVSGIFVSIDGDQPTHDSFRGVNGAYQKTMDNIKRYIAWGLPVRISTVVSSDNINSLESIIENVKAMGVYEIHFTILVNVGRAKESFGQVDNRTYYDMVRKIHQLRDKYAEGGFAITMRRDGKLGIETDRCYGGERMAHITATGLVAPCSYVAKCNLAAMYCKAWEPGTLEECLEKVKSFQDLCDERKKAFGHSSCAAMATMNDKTDPLSKDPLDVIFEDE